MGYEWNQMCVAVVGGGGFLGSHVVARLRELDCQPCVPRTKEGWDFRRLDSAMEYFQQQRPQVVFNCAARQGGLAYQQKFPADIFDDNLLLGHNTMLAARKAGVRKYVNVVAACSYPGYLDGMMTEEDYWGGALHETVVNYGFTKKSQVVQGWCYRKQYGFNSIHLLMTNLYGPGEHFHPDRSHGLAALLRKFYDAKRQNLPEVMIWGTGKPVREWLFVKDAADAMLVAAERYDDVAPINVSLGGGLSIIALAELIAEIVGYEGRLVCDPSRPDGALVKTFANDRFQAATGWSPKTSLREGVVETLGWLELNYEAAVRDH